MTMLGSRRVKAVILGRRIRVALMKADIATRTADTELKQEQLRWEPWKALSAALGAGVAFASGLIAVIAWVLTHAMQNSH
jgi:hypothetical protein